MGKTVGLAVGLVADIAAAGLAVGLVVGLAVASRRGVLPWTWSPGLPWDNMTSTTAIFAGTTVAHAATASWPRQRCGRW